VARMGAAQAPSSGSVVDPRTRRPAPVRRLAGAPAAAWLALVLAVAAAVRAWQLNGLGFNSDEAVYAGQAAAIADHPELGELFPVFRAHPLLVQTLLSVGFRLHLPEGFERLAIAALGVATVGVVYELGRLLYGRPAGLVAALLMALMPYHVVVTRQVLLDGPMTLFATLTLLLLVRFVLSGRPGWLYGAGAAMGLSYPSTNLLGLDYATPRDRGFVSSALQVNDMTFAALSVGLGGVMLATFASADAPSAAIVPLNLLLAGLALFGALVYRAAPQAT